MQQSRSKKSQANKPDNRRNGVVRIIGGSMRGRKLRFSTVEGLRPTLDRIRETLFNWLAKDVPNCRCLDLFSGSGALGFEAASRGAAEVFMVERSAKVARDLKNNCQTADIKNIKVVNLDAKLFLQNNELKFDLVFLDPPFGKGLLENTLTNVAGHLNPGALVYIEQENSPSAFQPTGEWRQVKYKKTASFSYGLYQLKSCAG